MPRECCFTISERVQCFGIQIHQLPLLAEKDYSASGLMANIHRNYELEEEPFLPPLEKPVSPKAKHDALAALELMLQLSIESNLAIVLDCVEHSFDNLFKLEYTKVSQALSE